MQPMQRTTYIGKCLARVFRSGYGRCRSCERKHTKAQQRTLGGRFILGKSQATFNEHKWDLSFQQYAAIVASGECFYCGKPLPTAAGGLDRKENADYTWDACCHVAENSRKPRVHEAAMKPRAVEWHRLCCSPSGGMKNTASCPRNRISLIDCESLKPNGIGCMRLSTVWIQRG